MDENVSGSLLIIGNGFDLNCRLNSRFYDFYKTVNPNSNIWYLLFHFAFFEEDSDYNRFIKYIPKKDILWMDVEDFIKRILFMHHQDDKDRRRYLISNYSEDSYCGVLKLAFEQRNNNGYLCKFHQFSTIRQYFLRLFPRNNVQIDIVDFLKKELEKFECDFREYINGISNNESYEVLSGTILKELNSGEEAFDIITFNYTHPSENSVAVLSYGNINHIHGDINNEVIIGFDASDIELKEGEIEKVHLSKSFQKLFSKCENNKLPNKNQIYAVKTYGHSLGEQDYSYFHAIFDYYDIYDNGNIVWEFYYTPFAETDGENNSIRENYIAKVYSLLNNYSLKNNRGDKINSLISRLLLENRLLIKTIDKTEDLIKKHNLDID